MKRQRSNRITHAEDRIWVLLVIEEQVGLNNYTTENIQKATLVIVNLSVCHHKDDQLKLATLASMVELVDIASPSSSAT